MTDQESAREWGAGFAAGLLVGGAVLVVCALLGWVLS